MRTFIIASIALLITTVSCKEIIAEDISGDTPVLILPMASDTVDINPVHFKWDEMDGASKYHLTVVSPSFNGVSAYLLDTIVSVTDFYYSLDSNEYELKLQGLNAGYSSTELGPIKFYVGVTSSGNGSTVVLNDPDDGSYINSMSGNSFDWSDVSGADSYEISIREGTDFAAGNEVDQDNGFSTSGYTSQVILEEGFYIWGVRAYVNGNQTGLSTFTFAVDTTTPAIPILGSPQNQGFESLGTVQFTWNNGTDAGVVQSPTQSYIEISTDIGFATIIESAYITGASYSFDFDVPQAGSGTYYWRVTNEDEAGNVSFPSGFNQFTVN